MLAEFKKYILDKKLIKPSDRILMAVSGGVDSMVMSHLFLEAGYRTGIIHCNFSLRASESDKDEEMVREYAGLNSIPFYTRRFETKIFARKNGLSVQMAARELRYAWFEEVRVENNFDCIAVAHNLNDNIETLLINLTRGTGISGMTGMKPSFNNIIRPLLFATRNDILKYCHQHSIKYREDKSNSDTKYIRNKIRHLIVPLLKEINPSIEFTLNETAERFQGISEILAEHIAEIQHRVSEQEGELITYNVKLLKKYIINSSVLYELFKPYGIANVRLNDLRKVIEGKTGGQIYTETHRIIKNRNEIIVTKEPKGIAKSYYINKVSDFKNIPEISSAKLVDIGNNFEIPSDSAVACIDYDKIRFPLIVRSWKPGDYFYPLGMRQRKKLSDYFIDNKYSILDKEIKLVIESEGKILWVVGDRIDNRYRISKSTSRGLIIKSVKKPMIIKPVN